MTGELIIPLAFGLAASAATMLGGLLALRFSERITVVLGLTAGVVIGVAFFDLLPEALAMGGSAYGPQPILVCAALGLITYMLLDRALSSASKGSVRWRAHLGPASLTLHSLLDGVMMGLAFQVSPEIGGVVALAVLTHDVADGVNTVSLAMAASRHRTAFCWLIVNGAAPFLGVVAGLHLDVPPLLLAPLLAAFAGVFLYIGACELLPRSHALDPRWRTTLASVAGILLMLAVAEWAK